MDQDDEDITSWVLALESALLDGCEVHELINITRGRILPEENRARIWHVCLGGSSKINNFTQFDEIFDLPEQSIIRATCKSLVDKLGNDEEDKVSIVCDTESIFTYYCKSRHLKFDPSQGWSDILIPLLAVKMPRDHIYACLEEILEKYIPRDTGKGAPIYHLLRLLLLYHDPQLTTFLDSKKICPDLFFCLWMKSLFASICTLDAITALWDIYFQERDPFYMLFLSLVILINGREQILVMGDETREKIVETLINIPSALSVDDVPDFCSLARYYSLKTPGSFRKGFFNMIFSSVYMGKAEEEFGVGDLPLSQALCLPVSAEEVLDVCDAINEPSSDVEQVCFFIVDCRPSEQYNAGHLRNAFHLDCNLMLQQPSSFQTAVQGLFMAQKQAMASETPGCGNHLCFIGSGRESEDQYVHMVVASFLQRNTQYVSLAKGGYQAVHSCLGHSINDSLTDHDPRNCIACSPDNQSNAADSTGDVDDLIVPPRQQNSLSSKGTEQNSIFNKLSSVFKSKSTEMKDKLVEYITNPNGMNPPLERHVNPQDKGKLYRSNGDVFSIHDDEEGSSRSLDEEFSQLELVNISQWLKKPDVIASFKCHQVRENGYMFPSVIILMETLLFVVREVEGRKGEGHVTARRTLTSVIKITSKKKHPDLITFKYGTTLPDGEVSVSDMDRFLIPRASDATKVIKHQIMKLIEIENSASQMD